MRSHAEEGSLGKGTEDPKGRGGRAMPMLNRALLELKIVNYKEE
jgi:hypothetical protein